MVEINGIRDWAKFCFNWPVEVLHFLHLGGFRGLGGDFGGICREMGERKAWKVGGESR